MTLVSFLNDMSSGTMSLPPGFPVPSLPTHRTQLNALMTLATPDQIKVLTSGQRHNHAGVGGGRPSCPNNQSDGITREVLHDEKKKFQEKKKTFDANEQLLKRKQRQLISKVLQDNEPEQKRCKPLKPGMLTKEERDRLWMLAPQPLDKSPERAGHYIKKCL